MGAVCGTVTCKGKKHSKYPNGAIIKRPQKLVLSMDEEVDAYSD